MRSVMRLPRWAGDFELGLSWIVIEVVMEKFSSEPWFEPERYTIEPSKVDRKLASKFLNSAERNLGRVLKIYRKFEPPELVRTRSNRRQKFQLQG